MISRMIASFSNSEPVFPSRQPKENPLAVFEITALVSSAALVTIVTLKALDALDGDFSQKPTYNASAAVATGLLGWSLFSIYVLKPKQR